MSSEFGGEDWRDMRDQVHNQAILLLLVTAGLALLIMTLVRKGVLSSWDEILHSGPPA